MIRETKFGHQIIKRLLSTTVPKRRELQEKIHSLKIVIGEETHSLSKPIFCLASLTNYQTFECLALCEIRNLICQFNATRVLFSLNHESHIWVLIIRF